MNSVLSGEMNHISDVLASMVNRNQLVDDRIIAYEGADSGAILKEARQYCQEEGFAVDDMRFLWAKDAIRVSVAGRGNLYLTVPSHSLAAQCSLSGGNLEYFELRTT